MIGPRTMGRTFLFQCPRCSYRAAVAGGHDRGAHCVIQTIRCLDCNALADAPVRLRLANEDLDQPYRLWKRNLLGESEAAAPQRLLAWHNRLMFGGVLQMEWVPVKLRCPVSAHHRIEPWRQPGKCPRCGSYLERALTPYQIWD